MADFVGLGFDLAFKYRTPVMMLADGIVGQMMEKSSCRRNAHVAPTKKSLSSALGLSPENPPPANRTS